MLKKLITTLLFFITLVHLHSDEIDLSCYEKSLYTQQGEDGVIAKIFQLIPPKLKYCVELGAADGVSSSTTYLLRLQEWHTLLLDRSWENQTHNLFKEFITAENINALFKKYQIPSNLDFLSININYNDFYIWQALDSSYQPALVSIAYNATHLPEEDKVVKYLPYFTGGTSNYYGASILSLYRLGRSKGYSLVYADQTGNTLFFIRDDLITTSNLQFINSNDVGKIYRPPQSGKGPNGGRPADPKNREYLSSIDLIKN